MINRLLEHLKVLPTLCRILELYVQDLFLYIKATDFASVLSSSIFTPQFLFHSLLLVMEKLGTRKETERDLSQFAFPNKHVFTQDEEQTSSTSGLPVTSPCSEKMVQFPRQTQKMRHSFTCSMRKVGGYGLNQETEVTTHCHLLLHQHFYLCWVYKCLKQHTAHLLKPGFLSFKCEIKTILREAICARPPIGNGACTDGTYHTLPRAISTHQLCKSVLNKPELTIHSVWGQQGCVSLACTWQGLDCSLPLLTSNSLINGKLVNVQVCAVFKCLEDCIQQSLLEGSTNWPLNS